MEWIQRFVKNLRQFGLERYGRYYGTYRGIVHNNQDPEKRGRLQLEVPNVYGRDVYKYWALPKAMPAGNDKGFFFIPEKGDTVWVVFEAGDPKVPIWEHGWWRNDENPARNTEDYPNVHTWSWDGNRYELDKTNGLLRIVAKDGQVIEVNKEGISLGSKDKSAEPAVLGDKNVQLWQDFIAEVVKFHAEVVKLNTALKTFATAQEGVAASVSIYAPLSAAWTALKLVATEVESKLPPIATKANELSQDDAPNTKSKIVTLD